MHFKTNSSRILILIMLSALLCGCRTTAQEGSQAAGRQTGPSAENVNDLSGFGPEAPKWAKTGALPSYPRSQYITGLGYSPPDMPEVDAHSQAKAQAFKDISDQIETQISNNLTVIMRDVFHNDNEDSLVDVKSITKQVTEELLPGAEMIQRYYDAGSGTAAAFAVMDRLKLSKRLLKKAEEARAQAFGFMQGYEQEAAQKQPSPMLKTLIHAQSALDAVRNAHLKAIAVGATQEMFDQFEALNDAELSVRITREVSALNDHIQIVPIHGNNQKALLTGSLSQPIEIEVTWSRDSGRIPLKGFPMKVRLDDSDKAAAVASAQSTDETGLYSFTLQELKATGSSTNTVAVALDFSAVEARCSLSAPFTEITYLIPSPDTTRIGVVISETIDREANPKSYIGSALKDALTEIGFQVIRVEFAKPIEEIVALPASNLLQQFGTQCDYLIVGSAESELSSQEGRFIFYRVRVVLDALELGTAKTIHLEIPFEKTKAGQGTKSKAMRASFNKASSILAKNLTAKFIARFEEGADWTDD